MWVAVSMHIHSTHAVLICVCERKWINALFLGRGGRGGLCRQLTRCVWFRVLFTWVESIALAHSPHSFPKVTSALAPHFTTYSCKLIGGCFTFSSKKITQSNYKKKEKKKRLSLFGRQHKNKTSDGDLNSSWLLHAILSSLISPFSSLSKSSHNTEMLQK